jgi:hypothetical protein
MANESMKIVGIGRSSGTYEGHNYDNTILHCTYDDEKVTGVATVKLKVPTKVYMADPVKVGDSVIAFYDRWSKVCELRKV